MSVLRPVLVSLVLSGMTVAQPVFAETTLVPRIQGGARYDTNPRYVDDPNSDDAALGTLFDVRLPIEFRSARASLALNPRLVYSFYPDDDDKDLEDRDKYLTGTANWLSRRSQLGVGYGVTSLSLRTSELQDPGGSAAGGSGQIRGLAEDAQRTWYVRPNWQLRFSPANSLALNGGYEEVRYDREEVSTRFDYDFLFAGVTLRHAFNERHSLSLLGRSTKFDSINKDLRIQNDSQTNSISLIYEYAWSEVARLSANIGWARTENTVVRPNAVDPVTGPFCNPALIPFFPCEAESDASNFVGNLTATKNSETVEYSFLIGQSITPNSNGAEVLRFNVDLRARKRFSQRTSAELGALAFIQNDVGESENELLERDYLRADARAVYRFARRWSVYARYAYTWNKQPTLLGDDREPQNHFISAGITFQGDGWRW